MEDQIENQITSLFNKWNNSLLTEDPKEVIKLYKGCDFITHTF